ncbi:1885_t:CDS:10 [Paraglomus occultum]|uniref:1885_t:CDS:1 n=1 Tax=Paraglomus occultum TaxID=144539 RepID=A0A9N9F932_9GLOM|nr:1885_t:CDS:10 [Paraglomus occultum]
MGNEQAKAVNNGPLAPHVKPMLGRFGKGVKYNMKIIIRGDIRTGKSTLFHRLQGLPFREGYTATPQIEVANIQWTYNNTDDVIKVEIWDVVDKATNTSTVKSSSVGLKFENDVGVSKQTPPTPSKEPNELALDAENVNVYRNTQGVILMFDITKKWTFEYAVRELIAVPDHMAVLLLGNFADLSAQRTVSTAHVYQVITECNGNRSSNHTSANKIRYVETSMLSGLGLDYIYKYFGVPFLQLQRDILSQQLEEKSKEISNLLNELDADVEIPAPSELPENNSIEDKSFMEGKLEYQQALKSFWEKEFHELGGESNTREDNTLDALSSQLLPSLHIQREKVRTPDPSQLYDFNAGKLEDDFFDDTPETLPIPPRPTAVDSDDAAGGNPMVAGDEDLEGSSGGESEGEGDRSKKEFQSGIWHRRDTIASSTGRGGVVSSGSSDVGDEMLQTREDEELDPSVSASFSTRTGYEEISSGSPAGDNPWAESGQHLHHPRSFLEYGDLSSAAHWQQSNVSDIQPSVMRDSKDIKKKKKSSKLANEDKASRGRVGDSRNREERIHGEIAIGSNEKAKKKKKKVKSGNVKSGNGEGNGSGKKKKRSNDIS